MPAEMKEIIAQAAQRLLAEKHAKKLTVKDIVEECQITRQSFYYHFKDIPALFRYILQCDGERLQRASDNLNDPEKALKYFFHIAINAIPDVRCGMQTNYRDEFQQLIYEYISSSGGQRGKDKPLRRFFLRRQKAVPAVSQLCATGYFTAVE